MKIAFCFLTRGDLLQPNVWNAFFAAAPPERYSVYCHPKDPAAVVSPLLRDGIIPRCVETRHGHASLVQATVNLFAHACETDADVAYCILLSESTVPIVPFAAIHDALARLQPRSLVPYQVPPPGTEHHGRLAAVRHGERFASAFFQHDQWIVLHRRHVVLLREAPALDLFANMFAPDEHYFMNVLIHMQGAPLGEFVNRRTSFVNWREREVRTYTDRASGRFIGRTVHPKTYRSLPAEEIAAARNQGCWFFRKIDAACDCTALLPSLESRLAAS
jgi:hypothetical protein